MHAWVGFKFNSSAQAKGITYATLSLTIFTVDRNPGLSTFPPARN